MLTEGSAMNKTYRNTGISAIQFPNGGWVRPYEVGVADPGNPGIQVLLRGGRLTEASEESNPVNPTAENLGGLTVSDAKLLIADQNNPEILARWKEADERITIEKLIDDKLSQLSSEKNPRKK